MIYIFLVVFAIYYLFLLVLIMGWQKAISPRTRAHVSDTEQLQRISVVVSFRNEAVNLEKLIKDLSEQTYVPYEVILVNDHSDDLSAEIAYANILDKPDFVLLDNLGVGKKQALTTGINAARGELIAVTDADCSLPPDWLRLFAREFLDPSAKMAFGVVKLRSGNDLFTAIQALEFSAVVAVGAALHAMNRPVYCNGANMVFTRDAFQQVNGYAGNDHIPSGDDEFLLKKIWQESPGSVRFVNAPGSVVETLPQPTARAFIHQRVRWAGKWRHTPGFFSKVVALFVLVVQIGFLGLITFLFLGIHVRLVSFLILAKILLEFVMLFNIGAFLQAKVRLFPFFVLQVVYPLYVMGTGLLSHFMEYSWKGRNLRSKASAAGHI